MLNKTLKNQKGISLTLITGLVSLLMVTSVAINELIIRNFKSIQRIEASNKAYFAAESGIEDALYELSPRFPGYQTPPLGVDGTRSSEFGDTWKSEWEIRSRSGMDEWEDKMYQNEKLMIFLFNDTNNEGTDGNPGSVDENAINTASGQANDIKKLDVGNNFSIEFSIPEGVISSGKLKIDNDGDGLLDEDGVYNPSDISTLKYKPDPILCPSNPEDNDCDGLVNEDSHLHPVIMWKLTDGGIGNLIPIKGCLENPLYSNGDGSEICEDNLGQGLSAVLNQDNKGINQDGEEESIADFIFNTPPNSQIRFEFLIIAPMEHMQGSKKIEIPYIEYKVKSGVKNLPYPYYTIKSDGYHRGFKQSITATVRPKTTVPLFDFTIIQQQ